MLTIFSLLGMLIIEVNNKMNDETIRALVADYDGSNDYKAILFAYIDKGAKDIASASAVGELKGRLAQLSSTHAYEKQAKSNNAAIITVYDEGICIYQFKGLLKNNVLNRFILPYEEMKDLTVSRIIFSNIVKQHVIIDGKQYELKYTVADVPHGFPDHKKEVDVLLSCLRARLTDKQSGTPEDLRL